MTYLRGKMFDFYYERLVEKGELFAEEKWYKKLKKMPRNVFACKKALARIIELR